MILQPQSFFCVYQRLVIELTWVPPVHCEMMYPIRKKAQRIAAVTVVAVQVIS